MTPHIVSQQHVGKRDRSSDIFLCIYEIFIYDKLM